MKGDFTRSTFDHKKHYSGVRMQQGRVQLDADWNEQVDIQTYLLEQSLEDVVGPCGAPLQNPGFALNVDDDNNLMIGAGHYYVHGTLCENENECNYLEQENIKDAKLPKADGNYLFYLDVWQKHVTAVEDESISEIALGGPDTTTRTKTIWQVKYISIPKELDENPCIQSFEEWDKLTAKRDAQLKASVDDETDSTDPCIVPSGAGYRGLENHLYRVEIHRVDDGNTTFKWSRDNGSILRAVDEIDDDDHVIKIKNAGQDILHAFEPDQWIEITDEKHELNGKPGTLVHLTEVKDGVELKFDPDDPDAIIGDMVNSDNYPEKYNPKVRRWDQTESGEINKWIELEHGLGVQFDEDGNYKSGDFWLIPARTADGDIEWSPENGGWHQRFGIEHQYCPLAIFNYDGENWGKIKDCRRLFPNMTEMITLSYVGGDGQEAMPGEELPAPLQVRVSAGQHPVKDARVQFSIIEGSGILQPNTKIASTDKLTIITDDDGLAGIRLQLDNKYSENITSIGVEASLLDAVLLDDEGESIRIHPTIYFQANVSIAKKVYYDHKLCPELNELGINTVQDAIDELCKYKELEESIHIREIYLNSTGKQLANDSSISIDDLASGIKVLCDQPIDQDTIKGKPTCFITLDMPYPINSADVSLWGNETVIGFQPIILAADLKSNNERIYWNPDDDTKSWLKNKLFQNMPGLKSGARILAHLTLKGNFIRTKNDPYLYLDGEAFGVQVGETETNLDLSSGNGRRGGDFEMWFWLSRIRYVEYNIPEGLIVEKGLCDNGTKNCETQGEISGGRFYAMVGSQVALNDNSDALVDLLVNEGVDDEYELHEGESIILEGGITLRAEEIDVKGNNAQFSLSKQGETFSDKVVNVSELYTHIEGTILGEEEVPVFVTFVEAVFAGMNTNVVRINSIWLIDA